METRPNTKINLGLNVLRRREDGYHDIETLLVPYFGLCDRLEIVAGEDYSRTARRLQGLYGDRMAAGARAGDSGAAGGFGVASAGGPGAAGGFGVTSAGDSGAAGGFGVASAGGPGAAGGFGVASAGGPGAAGGFGVASAGGPGAAGGFGVASAGDSGAAGGSRADEESFGSGVGGSRGSAASLGVGGYGTEGGGDTETDEVPQLKQWITADGKCMITIARAEGVHWEPGSDLCVRAYELLDAEFILPPVKIFLEKLSPVGAGLGGGSADAAFTLKMLSEMFSLPLDDAALIRFASRLGSDCPFFILNRPQFGEGRGEILSEFPLPELDDYEVQVVVPQGVTVSTAEAYRGVVPYIPSVALRSALRQPVSSWREAVVNDFEESVFKKYPQLAAVKQSLYDSGAAYASLSGSGSSLFALYPKD